MAVLSDSTETRARLRCSMSGVIAGKRSESDGISAFSSASAPDGSTPSRRRPITLKQRAVICGRLDGHRRGIEDVHRRRREVERTRENADDVARAAVDVDAAADDRRVRAVAPPPEILRDEDRRCGALDQEVSPGSKSWPSSGRAPSRVNVLGVIRATVTRSGASPSVMLKASLVEYAPSSVKERALFAKWK